MLSKLAIVVFGVLAFVGEGLAGPPGGPGTQGEPGTTVFLASDIEWKPLNPARGDKGPQAGTLWGDQTADGASGFLVKFVDGFTSPPHIHNITYRGVVLGGLLHNDDPDARPMWMPAGSYWMQPAGEVHITASRGTSVAFVEIQEGPYLVLPSDQATDNGERAVNLDASNLVWLDASATRWVEQPDGAAPSEGPQIAFLWGDPIAGQLNGSLVKLPAGFSGELSGGGPALRTIVIEGELDYQADNDSARQTLGPGSRLVSAAGASQRVSNRTQAECLLYARTKGVLLVTTAPAASAGE
ncbi:hypothetical protein Mal64_27370 [Pseudobythopirellula maris]|uniref:ChrR Cupin-like domain protein n=1 Tax=Pseudobythopirellula maris TaxID=2527991 RepID=A0A5C5ZIH2_9BACT|nr:DUF4437 domain-containing protein [Pseudobythopirellula maris]TWT87199.1 hypothetical protein Mal64_27370 [Pseudobythopirellula maris]